MKNMAGMVLSITLAASVVHAKKTVTTEARTKIIRTEVAAVDSSCKREVKKHLLPISYPGLESKQDYFYAEYYSYKYIAVNDYQVYSVRIETKTSLFGKTKTTESVIPESISPVYRYETIETDVYPAEGDSKSTLALCERERALREELVVK